MASMTGTVSCLQVFDDGCFVQIVNPTQKQAFAAWFSPPDVTAFERIMHSMWVSLFRESLTRSLPLTITTDTSSKVTAIQLGEIQ
jgi:hypothetical protein